jgi:DNA-binding transcriptional MerR regulator
MATETTTVTLPLNHLYYLTADSNNDTGYTLEEVQALIDEKGGSHQIEVTITHPVPPPYTVEGDIAAHEERILNNQNSISQLTEQLSNLQEDSEEYLNIQEQLSALEQDIQYCQEHIQSLK